VWPNNTLGLLVNLGYYILVLWLTDEARRHLKIRWEWTSRVVHVALAIFVVPTLTFFSAWWWAVLVPLLMVGILALAGAHARRRGRTDRMRRTVFMLAAYAVLTVVFWSPEWRFVTATAVLAATASLVTREIGDEWWHRDQFSFAGERHSLEAVLLSALVLAVMLAMASLWFAQLTWALVLGLAMLLTLVGTLAALVSVRDTAQLTLPAVLALLFFVLVRGGVQVGPVFQLVIGIGMAALIALAGFIFGALSPSGAAGAIWIGAFTFGLGGWHYAVPLIVFFMLSSLLSRLPEPGGGDPTVELTGKTGRRTLSQTLANGGVAAALAAVKALGWLPPEAAFAAYLGAVAAANADTWATEIGTRMESQARLLVGWQPVPAGTSGAITLPGSLASAAGALVIGVTGGFFGLFASELAGVAGFGWALAFRLGLVALAGGIMGSLVDSLLGATWQAVYKCPECGRVSERRRHGCAHPGELVRGVAGLDNDAINLLATVSGALVALLIMLLI
jgi:uncharacterized protein (TIGR00297 family)